MTTPTDYFLLRLPEVLRRRGRSRSAHYLDIEAGLFPHSVSIGPGAIAWPDYEVSAVNAARVAGRTEEEIRRWQQREGSSPSASSNTLQAIDPLSQRVPGTTRVQGGLISTSAWGLVIIPIKAYTCGVGVEPNMIPFRQLGPFPPPAVAQGSTGGEWAKPFERMFYDSQELPTQC